MLCDVAVADGVPTSAVGFVIILSALGFVVLTSGECFVFVTVASVPDECGAAGVGARVFGFQRHGKPPVFGLAKGFEAIEPSLILSFIIFITR